MAPFSSRRHSEILKVEAVKCFDTYGTVHIYEVSGERSQ